MFLFFDKYVLLHADIDKNCKPELSLRTQNWFRLIRNNENDLETYPHLIYVVSIIYTGRSSSIGSVSAWHASGSCPLGMHAAPSSIPTSGIFFRGDLVMKIFLLPLIQEELLSVTSERMCTKLPRSIAQEQCGPGNWQRPKWPKMCWSAVKQNANQSKSIIYPTKSLLRITPMHIPHIKCLKAYVSH